MKKEILKHLVDLKMGEEEVDVTPFLKTSDRNLNHIRQHLLQMEREGLIRINGEAVQRLGSTTEYNYYDLRNTVILANITNTGTEYYDQHYVKMTAPVPENKKPSPPKDTVPSPANTNPVPKDLPSPPKNNPAPPDNNAAPSFLAKYWWALVIALGLVAGCLYLMFR